MLTRLDSSVVSQSMACFARITSFYSPREKKYLADLLLAFKKSDEFPDSGKLWQSDLFGTTLLGVILNGRMHQQRPPSISTQRRRLEAESRFTLWRYDLPKDRGSSRRPRGHARQHIKADIHKAYVQVSIRFYARSHIPICDEVAYTFLQVGIYFICERAPESGSQ